ncbi:MAG: DUF3892 domain-containing protein [Tepidisphaeraceae bacterium]
MLFEHDYLTGSPARSALTDWHICHVTIAVALLSSRVQAQSGSVESLALALLGDTLAEVSARRSTLMASRHEVRCINKSDRPNPHERILSIGGVNADQTRWKLSQAEAIAAIERNEWQFYVSAGGRVADVVVSTSRFGNKYLKTTADGEHPDNLLSLPECP